MIRRNCDCGCELKKREITLSTERIVVLWECTDEDCGATYETEYTQVDD